MFLQKKKNQWCMLTIKQHDQMYAYNKTTWPSWINIKEANVTRKRSPISLSTKEFVLWLQ